MLLRLQSAFLTYGLGQCAEAVMTPFVSNPEDLFFVGNAPSGHISYRLSDPNYKVKFHYLNTWNKQL